MLPLFHAGVTLVLVGLIWTIQVVHYPLFGYVDPERFASFHAQHARRITWLVGALMPAEALLAVLLVVRMPSVWTWVGVGLVALIWLATAMLAVPQHAALTEAFDPEAHRRLVRTNWVRTLAWTARGVLALALLASACAG